MLNINTINLRILTVITLIFILFVVLIIYINKPEDKKRIVEEITKKYSNHFELVSKHESKNNKVYAFYTNCINFTTMEEHASSQKCPKGNTTIVLYFNSREDTPDISKSGYVFNFEYKEYCIAIFEQFSGGSTKFTKYPFEPKKQSYE